MTPARRLQPRRLRWRCSSLRRQPFRYRRGFNQTFGLALLCGAAIASPKAPEAVAREFYDAFCKGDTATMERLYAPDVTFQDEIFSFKDRAGTTATAWMGLSYTRLRSTPSVGRRTLFYRSISPP